MVRRILFKILTERIDALLAEAGQLDFGIDETVQLLRQRDQAMQPPSHAEEK